MFISFEGIEGSGKSTAQRLLAEHLQGLGYDPLLTREPGGCALGRSLRPILLDARTRGLSSRAELYLFLADRAQHVAEVIRPALEAGQTVLCDRYADSTLAYQGYGRGLDPEHLRRINDMATGGLMPDLTLLLDLPVHCGLERAGLRNREEGTVLSEGRFDAESLEFHERVRQGYRSLAAEEPERFAIIDAAQPPEDVVLQCISAVEASLRQRGRGLD
ncbi:dTMP kinase [Desulfovibrio fairfieldensis]|uniref:Thymidylate kinase n=1 Tax=Desulfovibrio fairfieldensis TaxID=44742 RepID=A0A109W501_9BACT|nr:dTMP kinase [Desulfovibrio fairfieldensis]AMD91231.1 thymidylate kinase [Desulfovibrio fairfieldensis]GKG93761.1 thymidylate kinase [Desulfovibrionaceae bacterium]GKI12313.1 thymidylate kinase [Desulfovibrionaceae bacterium]